MMSTIEALDAWWPPTLTPEWLARPALAASTMAAECLGGGGISAGGHAGSFVSNVRPAISAYGGVLAATNDPPRKRA
jgi:hypothetical protein